MKKKLLLITLLSVNVAMAQNFIFVSPKTDTLIAGCNEGTVYKDITLKNTASSSLDLSYRVVLNTLSSCSRAYLCDWTNCYPDVPSSTQNPVSLASNQEGIFKLDVTSTDTAGIGTLKIEVFETANPSMKDTLTFILKSCITGAACGSGSTSIKQAAIASVNIYPNPVINKMVVETPGNFQKQVIIFNILGEQQQQLYLNSDKTIFDLKDLSPGIYFMELRDKEGKKVVRKFIRKN